MQFLFLFFKIQFCRAGERAWYKEVEAGPIMLKPASTPARLSCLFEKFRKGWAGLKKKKKKENLSHNYNNKIYLNSLILFKLFNKAIAIFWMLKECHEDTRWQNPIEISLKTVGPSFFFLPIFLKFPSLLRLRWWFWVNFFTRNHISYCFSLFF